MNATGVYGTDWCLLCFGCLEGQEKLVGFCVWCECELLKELLDEAAAQTGEPS